MTDDRELSNRRSRVALVRRGSRFLRVLIFAILVSVGVASTANAATYTVSKTADTNDGVCNADCSLREAITVANATGGNHTVAFNIPIGVGAAVITLGSALPVITRNNLNIDGTTQTTNNGNTNPVILGAGGTVGVDSVPLSTVAGPEVEIRAGVAINNGFDIQATNVTIQGLAILGFGSTDDHGAIRIANNFSGTTIQNNVLGSTATSFTDPGAALRNWSGVTSIGGDNGTITNNLIGFSAERGIWMDPGSTNWTVSNNEIRDVGMGSVDGDGTSILAGCDSLSYTGNLFTGSSSQAAAIRGSTNVTFTNNTITGNGVGDATLGVAQSAGVTVRPGAISALFDRNIFLANYGAGLQINDTATGAGTRLTRNSFVDNGTILARDLSLQTGQMGIDLNHVPPPLPAEDPDLGTTPFYTPNDTGDTDAGGNTSINFPILDTATISGGNLTLTGWALPGATIELFITDGDPSGFGEGETYVGTYVEGVADTDPSITLYSNPINGLNQGTNTTNRFSFTVPVPAGVVDGTELTATGTIGNNTSEFSGRVVAVAVYDISGRVFEDVNYGGGAGRDQATSSGVARSGARVELYDATGTYVTFTTTDGSGNYSFSGLAAANYTVRVVNSSVTSSRTGYVPALLGVQTYRTDASSGSAVAETARVGGQDPSVADAGSGSVGAAMNTTTGVFTAVVTGTAQSITNVTLGASDISGVDFGYNFDTIVNINDSGQGSLRQFIDNANALSNTGLAQVGQTAGKEVSIFMIPVAQLTSGVAIVVPTTLLPPLTGANADNTSIDGTTQTTNVGNTNIGSLGAGGTVGLGADGVAATADEPALSQVDAPEIEIRNSSNVRTGLDVQANSITISGISIHGFGQNLDADVDGNIRVGLDGTTDFTGTLIENNIIGATAVSFASPPITTDGDGVIVRGADGGILRNNLIGFNFRSGVKTHDDVNGWLIENNEFRDNGTATRYGDGIDLGYITDTTTISGNLLINNGASGVDSYESNGSNTITNNTISGNGFAGQLNQETSGIRIFGTDSDISLNLIENSFGAGVLIVGNGVALNQPAIRNQITRNAFSANGSVAIDLLANGGDDNVGDGITVNDGALDANDGNFALDYPIIDSAVLSGGNLTITGFARAGVEIEFYEAVGAANDNNASGDPHGEGNTYLFTSTEGVADADATTGASYTDPGYGADPNVNRFSFTVAAPAGLVVGEEISPIAYLAANGTSEFGPNFVVTAATYTLDGAVFEDIAGNVLDGGEAIGDANNPTVDGVDIRLYNDDGATANQPDATDTLRAGPIATAGAGAYNFANIPNGTYWVVADSRTVSPSAGVHPSYLTTTPWSEQTYGPDSGWCADGIGGTTERVGAGACFGGVDGATDDDASALASSEHIARVVVSGGAVSNIDFGFSYNVVTNVEPAGNVSLTASTYQGSIDQFVRNANAVNGANAMRFVPAVPTNGAGGGGAWWRVDYTGSIIGETITNTHDANTSIDGTAFDLADGVTVRNTNPGNLGANAGGGLTVGTDDIALPLVARPELEVMRSDPAVGVAFYFYSNAGTAQTPNNYAVRDIATWGFVGGVGMTGIAPMRPSGVVVERNVIGSPPDGFADPAVAGTLRGVSFISTDAATVRDNLIGFVDTNGVSASSTTGTTITGNEIRESGQVDGVADGINYGGTSTTGTITANLIVDSGGMGVDGTATGNLIENNTVTGSGQGGVQTAGIRQTGSANTVRRNIVTGSIGPGIIVPDTVNAIAVTENRFGSNGSIAIDLIEAGGATATGDGIMLNDGALDAADGDDGLDFPVIDSAVISGGNLTVTGFARAGVTIEFYEAIAAANDNNSSGNPHGEGTEYLFTSVEGVADADATTGASYTDPGYGADPSVNRFSFTVATPAGLVIGEEISPIAYLAANGTSEFGPNFTVTGPTTAIAGTIFVDEAGDGLADGPIGVGPNLWEGGARIELYRAGPDGDADGGDDTYLTFTTSSGVDGSYSFTGLTADTYYITVDSQGVDDGPYNGTYTATDTWAEQTYGPVGAASFDGVSVWSYAGSAGSFYGGAEWDVSDDHIPANSLPTAEHIARVDTTGGNVNDVDFGFSFNVVTTTRGGSAAQDPGAGGGQRTVQGSLRQFITNANAQTGSNAMRFVPAAPTNGTLAGNNWWRVSITAALPNIEDASTIIDGAAYNPANGVASLNSNTAAIGSGAAVGVLGVFITPLLDPELEIQGDGVVTAAFNALATADNTEIRNTAINTFVTTAINATGILPDSLDSLAIENNVIGTSPASFTDNPSLFTGAGAFARDLSNSTIRNNLVGWVGRGFQISFDSVDTLIETNEIRGADTWSVYLNGAAGSGLQAERITLQGNQIESGGALPAVETQHALSDLTINQNTIRFNSVGVRLYGANNTVTGNIISDNSGDALTLVGNGIPSVLATSANLISQNQFGNNGGQAIDLTETGNSGDGVTINDDGDPDLGANELLNYPIIESAQILGPNLIVSGFALPGTTIEFYIADADPSGFGEGVTYLFTVVEGSGADSDATSGTYGPGPINGVAQGTDTTNRYTFTVPTPVGVSVGTDLTATGTIANATSEFSGRATVSNNADLVMTKVLDASTPGPFAEGDSVTYLLTVTNNGPAQATSVTATDTYPTELTLGAPVPSAPTTYVAGTGIWTIGTLNSGASATLLLPGTVNAGTAGDVVTNSVTAASGDQTDPTTVGDDLAETFTVLPFLSIDDVAQAETDAGTTTFTFTVSINQAVGYDVTFDIDTADGTATIADGDYVAISGGSGTITNGSASTTVDVTVNGDTDIEADETFFVNLSNIVGAAVTDAQGQGTINNDDSATVSVAATADANEAGPVNGQFTVTQSTSSDTDTVVSYTIAGTATAGGSDYATLSGSVTVLAGDTTATIDVTGIVADALVEGTETVIVTLTGTDNVAITVAASPNDTATVNILDNNAATVSVAATTDANEAGPVNGQFTVTQSTASASDTVVTYTIAGTATPGGTDYTTLSGTVTVLAGATTATIDVTGIVADALVEGTETVIVTLTATDNPGITVAASPADTATVNILDNNAATVSVAGTVNANEAGPVDGQFTVTQSATSISDTVVSYSIAGTATPGGTDYTTLSGTVTVLAGATTATIDVTGIVADALVEGTETVIVTLTGTDNVAITIAASPADTATVNILDNNAATVSVAGTVNANEAGPVDGQFTVTQSATSISDTVVSYSIAGTATPGGTDYTTLSGTVTVLAGATTATIDVTGIVADALVEGTETVIVTLTGTDNVAITIAASPNDSATISIIDADTANVSIAATTDGNEAGPVNGQFTVTQSTTSGTDTVITYTIAGTATPGGTDYTTLSGTVTVLAGATTATIDVTGIVADALVEGTETVIVTLTATDNPGITVAASPADTATVNILDNNAATVSIAAIADANEAGPVNGQFMVTQSATSISDTVVSYSIAGTATPGGTDYTTLSGSVTILAGDTAATIDVTGIVADALVEGNETVVVTLTGTDNVAITVAASPNDAATVNILDGNGATVSVASTADANEAGPVNGQFTVTQSTTSASDTVISYTVGGTATAGGTDYTTLSGTVTVLAGATTATIDVTGIVTDALVEGTETVILTLTSTDNVAIAVAASPNDTATVNILDNAAATVSVASTVDANEAGPVDGQFTVTQSTTSASDTVVSYTVAGTATAGGTDYATLGGTVTVLAGATTATIDVTGINADALIEGAETVIVTLTGTDNVGITVAASPNDTATVNILDNNAATVSVAATTDGNEAGPVDGQFTITQSATSVSDTVISYSVAGTAAAGGTDYASLSGSVTVLAGAATATIDVTGIVDDSFVEGSETVIVTLIGTDNVAVAVAASPNDTASINILDNDGATVSIASTTNGAESGPVDGVFTVTQSAASVNDTVLSYTVAGTATSASDYTALSGTVTILGGATTALINVPVIDDAVAEGIDETVVVTLSSVTASDPGISIAATPADTASLTIADNDADLITTKTVSNATPVEGASITYTISVNNSAGVQATNVSLADLLPAGVSYVSDDSGGTYNSTSGLWSIGTINAATVATLNITATVDAGASALAQPIANTTTAAIGDQADPDTSTDVLTANITVDANADLVTTKIVDNVTPVENATIVYTISVFNNGAAQATNVYLTDLLPTGISYVGDDTGGAYNPVTGVWTIGTIDNGAIATLNITATVDTGAGALAQPITNITTAAIGDQPDPDTTTDDLTEDITVNYTADIVTTKSVNVATPVAGDTIVYTLTATNNGPGPASNVSLTDLLPAGVTYLSDDGAGTYNSATGIWTIGSLANAAVATLNISATVDAGAGLLPQPITNTTTAALGDQADGDVTGDDLVADIIVNLIDPNLIQLTKTVGRDRANVGEIVSYSVEIRNTVSNPIGAVQISDSPSRGFKYVPGTAQLDGVPVADPTIGLPLQFDIGTLPGFVDGNGNGVADSGEPGYAVLSYRMVAGSGVAPGVWTNTAIATANCDTCFVSNIASADIEIIEDTLFDLGTIIGKVFYDGDNDGWQDSGEAGIEAAMVALDDGTYALTDEFGRYHFPAVKPGQRLLKINLNSLAGQAKATNGKTRIVSVTPGLMAKANFGVILETVDKAIGEDGQFGIGVDSETTHPPLLINGSTLMPSLLVNGEPVSLASADVKLGKQKIRDVVELANGKLLTPIRFSTKVDADTTVKRWKLTVKGSRDEIARTWKGKGTPPDFIEWDGVRKNGKLINSGGIYTYYLEMTTSEGQKVSSSYRLFGVNRLNSISLNLAGGAFISGSHELTGKAKNLLSETAKAIRAYPDEIVVISGHTDSVGSDESNMTLAERRARSAFDYLRKEEGLPEEQFVVQAFGETRPIAGNDTVWGRELNRRVEISGDLDSVDRASNYDPYRQPPVVRINTTDVEIDESGAFRTRIDLESGQETMNVLLSTSQGRSIETIVKLPTLHVISPQGRVAIPIDRDRAGPKGFDANGVLLETELLGRTEPENTVEFNGEPVDIDDNGLFMAPLPVRSGENYYGLVARNPMGMLRIANLRITLDDASVSEPEFVVEPVPQLALQLPPPGIPMTNSNLVVPGSTVPGNRVYINDNEIKVDADGSFTATVELKLGENLFTARVVDQDGHAGQIEQVFDYNGDPMFYMALVDGTVSKLQTTGSLQAAGNVKRDETVSRGRIAYYLKGHVLGKYLLTSAFDSGDQELGEIFSDLTAQDNDRLLTNLDPDTLYPVYGDNSTVVYDAQSQSKFYLALESETVTALIGNYALNFTDTELAGYQRTLYGASATYQSEAKDESGNSRTKAQAFYANIAQAHVRDELRATGGSLYYLSQRGVIEGSEHISVIVRDQDSGLILRRTALQQGLDYSIDYVDGRLLTNRPVSSFSADNSLVESDLLGGSAVYLQIDYETVLDGFEQTAMGGRVRQGIGERLAVGVTSVDEDQLGGEYSLKAADAEFRLGKNSRLIAEFATSEGNNSAVNISDDGGLTYQTVTPVAASSGDAFKVAAEIDAGEWFGYEDRLLMNTYYKRLDTGFSANSVTSEQGSEKSGFAASWEISDSNSLLGRFERQTQLAGGNENTLATLQWNFVRKLWGVAAEIEDRGGYAGDATIAALRMTNRWTDTLSTTLQHQQTLSGLENDQSTVGVAYRATDRLTLDASATQGTQGASAQLGAQFDWRGNRLYAAQQFNDLEVGGTSNNRLVGVEAPFGEDGAVYSEYHWSRLPVGRQRQAMFGARQRFQATDGLRIEISGEHSAENATTVNTGERYALSIGATFDNDGGITFSTRNEYRKDSRSIDSEQFLSTNNLKLALGDDLSVLGKYRFSKSDSSVQLNRNIDFTEASLGLAYRPVEHDRLNLLTRFTRLTNTPTEFQQASSIAGLTSDIFAVDWSYQVSQHIEWVGKQAMRWSESEEDPLQLRSRTSLSIQRLNWSMPKDLSFGTEYRLMSQDIADDQRKGFVTELMWEGLDPIVLGLGYNFSDVSDNEYVDYDFSTKGPFFRLQGKF